MLGRLLELLAPGLAQPHRQAAAVVGIGRAIDQAGADQASTERLTAGSPRRTAAATCLRSPARARRSRQQLAPGALGALGRAVGDEVCARPRVKRAASAAGDDPPNMIAA